MIPSSPHDDAGQSTLETAQAVGIAGMLRSWLKSIAQRSLRLSEGETAAKGLSLIVTVIIALPSTAEAKIQIARVMRNDPCSLPAFTSPGNVTNVNRSVGKPDGVSANIVSLSDLASISPNALYSVGIRLINHSSESGISCHATLHYADGSTQDGVLSLNDPGEYAFLQVQWVPDSKIADALARVDGLRTAKNLLVVPDLKSPSVQDCVGRAFALGTVEQFPGQLWAACSQEGGSNLISPKRPTPSSSPS